MWCLHCRGQYVNIIIDGSTYSSALSEGERKDAFDGATDDVIASLNAVGELFQGRYIYGHDTRWQPWRDRGSFSW